MCMPVPMTTRMYYRVHRLLHLVEVMHLVEERLMIDPSHMWIERTKQDWYFWTYSMHSILAKIVKSGEVLRRDIQEGDAWVLLHLFITTLNCIGQTLSSISKRLHVVQTVIIRSLADSKQDANAS